MHVGGYRKTLKNLSPFPFPLLLLLPDHNASPQSVPAQIFPARLASGHGQGGLGASVLMSGTDNKGI